MCLTSVQVPALSDCVWPRSISSAWIRSPRRSTEWASNRYSRNSWTPTSENSASTSEDYLSFSQFLFISAHCNQRCPWVHFMWPDPTQPVSWLTQPNTTNKGAYGLVVTYFIHRTYLVLLVNEALTYLCSLLIIIHILVLLLQWTKPNPTHQKLKNFDPTRPNTTQPMGQPNPWTTLIAIRSIGAAVGGGKEIRTVGRRDFVLWLCIRLNSAHLRPCPCQHAVDWVSGSLFALHERMWHDRPIFRPFHRSKTDW